MLKQFLLASHSSSFARSSWFFPELLGNRNSCPINYPASDEDPTQGFITAQGAGQVTFKFLSHNEYKYRDLKAVVTITCLEYQGRLVGTAFGSEIYFVPTLPLTRRILIRSFPRLKLSNMHAPFICKDELNLLHLSRLKCI